MTKFKVGDKVKKVKGYSWPGEVRSVFTSLTGAVRVVVECTVDEVKGALHIYNEDQLEAVAPEKKVYAVAFDVPASMKEHFTRGRLYKVIKDYEKSFCIIDDKKEERYCLWDGCFHLEGFNWTRVEI